jgi:hypothetical protein
MRYFGCALAGALLLILSVPNANAFVCVKGAYRAGCVSRYGAVGVGPGGAVAVGPHGGVSRKPMRLAQRQASLLVTPLSS